MPHSELCASGGQMIDFKNIPEAQELADIMYDKLWHKEDGILTDDEIFDITMLKPEYSLRRVSAGAIQIMDEKKDVERIVDKDGRKTFNYKWLPRILKEQTGFGILDCKRAIDQADGDMAWAWALLSRRTSVFGTKLYR
jgi:hypothetical protein